MSDNFYPFVIAITGVGFTGIIAIGLQLVFVNQRLDRIATILERLSLPQAADRPGEGERG